MSETSGLLALVVFERSSVLLKSSSPTCCVLSSSIVLEVFSYKTIGILKDYLRNSFTLNIFHFGDGWRQNFRTFNGRSPISQKYRYGLIEVTLYLGDCLSHLTENFHFFLSVCALQVFMAHASSKIHLKGLTFFFFISPANNN